MIAIITVKITSTDDNYTFYGYEYVFRSNDICIYKVVFRIVIEKSL